MFNVKEKPEYKKRERQRECLSSGVVENVFIFIFYFKVLFFNKKEVKIKNKKKRKV